MSEISLIILCAGNSTRFGIDTKKQWLRVGDDPLWLFVTKNFLSFHNFSKVIIASSKDEFSYMKNFSKSVEFVEGGTTRQESMKNALEKVDTKYIMVTDVARACVPRKVVLNLIDEIKSCDADCIVPILGVSDTVIYEENTINRDSVALIQTPQLSITKVLKEALNSDVEFTDDSSAVKAIKKDVKYIAGSLKSKKLTHIEDLKSFKKLEKPSNNIFTGFGIDIHSFEKNKPMVLGGVKIESEFGFKAHSDGDVLIHSVIDALLGAIGAGDIGEFFPDTNIKYKNADSKKLLEHIVNFVLNVGYNIVNVDLTILAETPKINPYKSEIKTQLAKILRIEEQFINIKATTAEKLGDIGKKKGVAVYSVASLKYFNWKKI